MGTRYKQGMAQCFALDPTTADLQISDGQFATQPTAAAALVVQVHSQFNRWAGDPQAGSRFHDLQAFAANPVPLVETEARRCLGALGRAGLITELKVRAEELSPGRIALYTECRDTAAGELVTNYTEVRR